MASEAVSIFLCGDWAPGGWCHLVCGSFPNLLDWGGHGVRKTRTSVLEKNGCWGHWVVTALLPPLLSHNFSSGWGGGAWVRRSAWAAWPASSSELPSPPGSSDCRWGGLAEASPHCTAWRALAPGLNQRLESCIWKASAQRDKPSSGQWPQYCWQPQSTPSLCKEGPHSWADQHWWQHLEMTVWSVRS